MGKKILVVDDEQLVIKSLEKLLKKAGYGVSVALNYDEALAAVKADGFNLIISDIRMAGKDGLEVVKDIRAYYRESHRNPVPEILITGYANEEKYNDALALGVAAYINKPFDIKELLETVKSCLGED